MNGWLGLPLVLQATAMLVDEFHFHRRRGLPRWERLGHPIDTLSVLACSVLALSVPPTTHNLGLYAALAALSCLIITKDEFVHAGRCQPAEQWLHAVLFVLHPIVLAVTAWFWFREERMVLWLSAALTAAFASYQILYWNVAWKKSPAPSSTTPSTKNWANAGTPPTTIPSRSYAENHDSETPG